MAPAASTTTKFERIVIDSRDRDVSLHPTPDRYDVRLHEDIFDVRSIKLIAADVPFSAYDVDHARNSVVPVRAGAGGAIAEARLPRGDYGAPQELAAALADALSAATGLAVTAAYVPRTDNFRLTAPAAARLQLPFASWKHAAAVPASAGAAAAARLLGFSSDRDYAFSPADGSLDSEFRRDARTGSRYMVLHMEPAEALKGVSSTLEKSFAVLQRHDDGDEPCVSDGTLLYQKRWDPPLARLARFSFRFTDYEGRPIDFQNQDHRLELLVEHEGMRKYQF
jgi:hypothetical protein